MCIGGPRKVRDWPAASQKLLKGGRPVAYYNAYRSIRRTHGNGSCLNLVMLIYHPSVTSYQRIQER